MSRGEQNRSPDLLHLTYFHNTFRSSEEVREFLYLYRDRPGSFIVRPSFSKPNCISISVVLGRQDIRHLNVHSDSLQYYLVPEIRFPSVNDLVTYYSLNAVYNEENVQDVRFLFPIHRQGRQDRRFTEPSIAGRGYQPLLPGNHGRRSGNAQPHATAQSRSFTATESVNFNDNSPRRGLSTRSEGGAFREQDEAAERGSATRRSKSFSADGQSDLKRSPHDRLPHIPPGKSRPKAPLPTGELTTAGPCVPFDDARSNDKDLGADYSRPRDAKLDLSGQLKETLKMIEENGICDCGLRVKDSQLPDGWSIHQIKDDSTSIRLFYQSPDGTTAWELPDSVAEKMSEEQRANIKMLQERCTTDAAAPEH